MGDYMSIVGWTLYEQKQPKRAVCSLLGVIMTKILKIGKVALVVVIGLIIAAAAIFSAIAWTHVFQEIFSTQYYVGDTYRDNYTITEIVDRHITAVVDNSNHILYDVLRDSSGDQYLAVHLDESGSPVKQMTPIVSERTIIDASDFDIIEELLQSRVMLCLYEIVLVLLLFFVAPLLNESLED